MRSGIVVSVIVSRLRSCSPVYAVEASAAIGSHSLVACWCFYGKLVNMEAEFLGKVEERGGLVWCE